MKKQLSLILALVMLVSLVACGGTNSADKTPAGGPADTVGTPKEPVTVNLGHCLAQDHPYNLGSLRFAELVKEYTDGNVIINVFHSSQLGGERELWEGCIMGTIDCVLAATAVLCNWDEGFYVYEMPFLFENEEHARAVLDGEIGQGMLDNLSKINMVGLDYWWPGWMNISTAKVKVEHPEDLKGLNMRTMESAPWLLYMKTLGANPLTCSASEVYVNLQNGTMDGCNFAVPTIVTWKLCEVQDYYAQGNIVYTPVGLAMSQPAWDKIPSEYHDVIRKAAKEAGKYEIECIKKMTAEGIAQMEEGGYETCWLDYEEWRPAVQPVYDELVGSVIPQEIYDGIVALAPSNN